MEYYSKCQTQQLAPALALCLGTGLHATALQRYFDAASISGKVWDSCMLKNRLLSTKYIVNYHTDEAQVYSQICAHKEKRAGHSPLSPFNSASDIFPNGILSTKWFQKYISELPFAVVCAYDLSHWNNDEDLGAVLESAKVRYSKVGVRFVGIIVSDGNEDTDGKRMAVLRQISGLAQLSGLFYVRMASLDKDCEFVVSTLVNNLKTSATDFYSAVEHRVKQRYRKYYTFPETHTATKIPLGPKFLEIRNLIKQAMLLQLIHPHNVEPSLTILEHSYESLILLLRDLMTEFSSPSVSDHDAKLYWQFRNLLDIIAIHLVRGYISVEDPVAALRKHDAHIANVVDATSSLSKLSNDMWLSIQYQWLAELMDMLPKSVLVNLHQVTKGRNKNNQKSVSYYGGITFHDKFYLRVVTEPALLYTKAAKKLEQAQVSSSAMAYLQVSSKQDDVGLQRISLLEKAIACDTSYVKDSDTDRGSFNGFSCLLSWQIAEEYMAKKDYVKAVDYYQLCLKNETWISVRESIIEKIIIALAELKDSEAYLQNVVQLSLLNISGFLPPQIPLSGEYDVSVDAGQFLSVDVFLYDKHLRRETHAFDTVVTQLEITSHLDTSFLKSLFPNGLVEFLAQSITVDYNEHSVTVPRGESKEKFQVLKAGMAANLDHLNDGIILQIEEEITKPGFLEVQNVTLDLKVRVTTPNVSVVFAHSETHEYNSQKITPSAIIYEMKNLLVSKPVRLDSRSTNKLVVLPYRPDISMKMSFPFSTIIVGEKLEVLFEISHKTHRAMNFSLVLLQARTAVLENNTEKEDLPVQTNWELLKDDEPLSILDILSSNETSQRTLCMSIRKPPETHAGDNLQVILEIKLLVTESTGTVSVYEMDTYLLPIVMEPFGTSFSVVPKCSISGDLEMPNPFVVGLDPSRDYSMPLPSRTWLATVDIADNLGLIKLDIDILSARLNLKSRNAEMLVEPVNDSQHTNDYVKQLFVTKSKHGFSDRNVAVVASAEVDLVRKGTDTVNRYETSEWDIVLPLQDPRILLLVKENKDTNGSERYVLTYVIENPTPRILTFTTTLTMDEAALQGFNWEFLDSRNLVPLKQLAFPVLPFSQHRIVYYGTCNVDEPQQDIQLPHLQAYDVNYKVSLPTLALDEGVRNVDLVLFLRTETLAGHA